MEDTRTLSDYQIPPDGTIHLNPTSLALNVKTDTGKTLPPYNPTTLQHPTTPYNTLQHPTTPYNTLQHPTTPYNTLHPEP